MVSRLAGASIVISAVILATCSRAPVLPSAAMLANAVTIRRDTLGIPHILARSEDAAAFGFGYAQAEDHAAEIVRRMIEARGEEAKYFGESGIQNDLQMAQFDNIGAAERGLSTVSPLYRRLLTAYAAGVNRYLEQHAAELPSWVSPISPADVLANSRAGAVTALAGNALRQQLQNKYSPPSAAGGAVDDPLLDDAPGSNAFALAGSRTVSGKPILLGNPHLNWSSLYWEAHVRVPGSIDFYGSTLVGIPVLRAGFNDRVGFVTTNNAPDLDDVYALALDPAHPDHYVFDGRSIPFARRDVTITVRTGDSSRQENRTFWNTTVGPVIYRTATHVFSVKSARLQAHRYFEGFYVLSKARSLDEWLAAMRLNLVPTSNFTYADADGNILYQWNGQVPIRVDAAKDYSLDVPAVSSGDVWTRLHPIDDLPRLLNPPGGYIQNANNPPAFVSLRDPIDMTRFPRYFERGSLALRPQLALDLLESQPTFSVDDVIRVKYDTRVLLASRVVQPLLDAVRSAVDAPEPARTGAAALAAWDGRVSAESRGAVLFQRFWDRYARRVRQPYATPWSAGDPGRTPSGLADPAAAVEELAGAVEDTRASFGSETVAWGDANRFRFGSSEWPGDGAMGTYGCFRVLRFDAPPGNTGGRRLAGNLEPGRPLTGFGDAWVLLVDFAPPVTGWSVLAYGQTTNLASPHSRDQIATFAGHALRRAWYTEAEIQANLEQSYRPK